MVNIFRYILIAIFLIIIGYIFIFTDQPVRQPANLPFNLLEPGPARPVNGSVSKSLPIPKFNQAEELRKNLRANINNFYGEIKEIKESAIIVNGYIPDLSKLDGLDYSKSVPIPTSIKIFLVKVTPNTNFPNKKFSQLKIDDWVNINSADLLYEKNEITALLVENFSAQ